MIGITFIVAVAAIVSVLILRGRLHRLRERVSGLETARLYLERRIEALEAGLGREVDLKTEGRTPAMTPAEGSVPTEAPPMAAASATEAGQRPGTVEELLGSAATSAPPRLTPTAPPEEPVVVPSAPAFAKAAASIEPAAAPSEARDWERFLGARLSAWLGGLARVLGVAYFVTYSFDRDLVSPALRVMIGLATGLGLLGAGLRLGQRAYAVTSQTLCATGVVIL
ncbi:MAG: DUF2339 domain-containing protein, partial [Nitrospira sp.]|nr:DUF2339 domain-containing protein [Nitrospira sp.]